MTKEEKKIIDEIIFIADGTSHGTDMRWELRGCNSRMRNISRLAKRLQDIKSDSESISNNTTNRSTMASAAGRP